MCCTGNQGPNVNPVVVETPQFNEDNLRWSMIVRDDEPRPIVPMIGDDSGNGLVMTTAAGAEPAYSAIGVSGLPALVYGAAGTVENFGEFANDWGFLHQPPSSGMFYINTGVSALNNQVIMRTKTAAAGPGAELLWNGGSFRFDFRIFDAAGGNLVLLQAFSVPAGNHTIGWRVSSPSAATGPYASTPVATLWLNGVIVATAAFGVGAISTLAPLLSQRLGSAYPAHSAFTGGAIRWGAEWSRALSDREMLDLHTRRNTITSQRVIWAPWLMGDSLTKNVGSYRRWLDVLSRRTKRLFKVAVGSQFDYPNVPAYDPIHDGVNGDTLDLMLARVGAALNRDPTMNIILGGTNNFIALETPAAVLPKMQALAAAMRARFNVPTAIMFLPRGDGTNAAFNTAVDTYNSLLRGAVPAAGLTPIDLYGVADATSPGTARYPYVNATMAIDGVGHPTVVGGVAEGDNAADKLNQLLSFGIGSD